MHVSALVVVVALSLLYFVGAVAVSCGGGGRLVSLLGVTLLLAISPRATVSFT